MKKYFMLFLFIVSCSSEKEDYNKLNEFISSEEVNINSIKGFEGKIRILDRIITEIDSFKVENSGSNYSKLIDSKRSGFEEKKKSIEIERESIYNKLKASFYDKIVSDVKVLHPASNIESIDLVKDSLNEIPSQLILNSEYITRMRGAFFGTHVFKITTNISGYYSFDDGLIYILKSISTE